MAEKAMDNGKIEFIINYKNEQYLAECLLHINRLQIPKGYEIGILSIAEISDREDEYYAEPVKSNAKYKVYLKENTFIIDDTFLYHIISIFRGNENVAAIGVLGHDSRTDIAGVEQCNSGRLLVGGSTGVQEVNYQKDKEGWKPVCMLCDVLIATQYEAEGTEGLSGNDAAVWCGKFIEKGYDVIIPYQHISWCLFDMDNQRGETYSKYKFLMRNIELWHDPDLAALLKELLESGQMSVELCQKLVEECACSPDIMKWYIIDLLTGTRKKEKYLPANGNIDMENKQDNVMDIITSFDEKWSIYAAVMLQSLYENNPHVRICAHVLQRNVSERNKRALQEQAESLGSHIIFYDFKREWLPADIRTTSFWPLETYFRLFVTDILPKSIRRALYLDPDIIVNKSIYEFYYMDMREKEIISCREFNRKPDGFGDSRDEIFASCMYEEEFEYFNAGVMLLNLEQLRRTVKGSDYIEMLKGKNGKLLAGDQDLLNLFHWKNTGFVDEFRYDFFPITCFGEIENLSANEVKQQASIIHYGGEKPWGGASLYNPHLLWWEYAVRTLEHMWGIVR